MEHTLLLRLQGPMQAWGVQSRFSVRETTREPTKSGVIGLLCAALGRERSAPLDDFAHLRMGVRVDREGKLMVDFHTAIGVMNAEGKMLRNAVLSTRYYLSDAVFLVGLQSHDLNLLEEIQQALKNPRWLLCLGRRSFPASTPVWLKNGLRHGESFESALAQYPWLIRQPQQEWERKKLPQKLRFVYERADGTISRQDAPLSFRDRLFAQRRISMFFAESPTQFFSEEQGG